MTARQGAEQANEGRLLRRVRWRLVAWSSGLTLLVVLLLGAALYAAIAASLRSAGVDQVRHGATAVEALLSIVPDGQLPPAASISNIFENPPLGHFRTGPQGFVAIIADSDGAIVGSSRADVEDVLNRAGVEAASTSGEDLREGDADQTPIRILTRRVERGGETYFVQVAQDRTNEAMTLNILLTVMGAGGLLAVLLAVGAGLAYSGRALGPIRESLRRQREFAADASHELRNPLAIIGGNVDQLLRHPERTIGESAHVLGDVGEEVDRLATLVDELLLLARSDSGTLEVRDEVVDLADVAAEGLQRLRGLADSRSVRLRLDGAPTQVRGDPDRIRQLVVILADNAIRHSPPDGTVLITVNEQDGAARLAVDDQGRGIRPEERGRIFDRFWRGRDAPAGGVGLGLAIAAWIVDHHRGSITADNRPGGGSRFTVRLPTV